MRWPSGVDRLNGGVFNPLRSHFDDLKMAKKCFKVIHQPNHKMLNLLKF